MYGQDIQKPVQPSRIRRFLASVIFMLIGAGISFLATSFYSQTKYAEGFSVGKAQGIIEGKRELNTQQQQAMDARSAQLLSSTN